MGVYRRQSRIAMQRRILRVAVWPTAAPPAGGHAHHFITTLGVG